MPANYTFGPSGTIYSERHKAFVDELFTDNLGGNSYSPSSTSDDVNRAFKVLGSESFLEQAFPSFTRDSRAGENEVYGTALSALDRLISDGDAAGRALPRGTEQDEIFLSLEGLEKVKADIIEARKNAEFAGSDEITVKYLRKLDELAYTAVNHYVRQKAALDAGRAWKIVNEAGEVTRGEYNSHEEFGATAGRITSAYGGAGDEAKPSDRYRPDEGFLVALGAGLSNSPENLQQIYHNSAYLIQDLTGFDDAAAYNYSRSQELESQKTRLQDEDPSFFEQVGFGAGESAVDLAVTYAVTAGVGLGIKASAPHLMKGLSGFAQFKHVKQVGEALGRAVSIPAYKPYQIAKYVSPDAVGYSNALFYNFANTAKKLSDRAFTAQGRAPYAWGLVSGLAVTNFPREYAEGRNEHGLGKFQAMGRATLNTGWELAGELLPFSRIVTKNGVFTFKGERELLVSSLGEGGMRRLRNAFGEEGAERLLGPAAGITKIFGIASAEAVGEVLTETGQRTTDRWALGIDGPEDMAYMALQAGAIGFVAGGAASTLGTSIETGIEGARQFQESRRTKSLADTLSRPRRQRDPSGGTDTEFESKYYENAMAEINAADAEITSVVDTKGETPKENRDAQKLLTHQKVQKATELDAKLTETVAQVEQEKLDLQESSADITDGVRDTTVALRQMEADLKDNTGAAVQAGVNRSYRGRRLSSFAGASVVNKEDGTRWEVGIDADGKPILIPENTADPLVYLGQEVPDEVGASAFELAPAISDSAFQGDQTTQVSVTTESGTPMLKLTWQDGSSVNYEMVDAGSVTNAGVPLVPEGGIKDMNEVQFTFDHALIGRIADAMEEYALGHQEQTKEKVQKLDKLVETAKKTKEQLKPVVSQETPEPEPIVYTPLASTLSAGALQQAPGYRGAWHRIWFLGNIIDSRLSEEKAADQLPQEAIGAFRDEVVADDLLTPKELKALAETDKARAEGLNYADTRVLSLIIGSREGKIFVRGGHPDAVDGVAGLMVKRRPGQGTAGAVVTVWSGDAGQVMKDLNTLREDGRGYVLIPDRTLRFNSDRFGRLNTLDTTWSRAAWYVMTAMERVGADVQVHHPEEKGGSRPRRMDNLVFAYLEEDGEPAIDRIASQDPDRDVTERSAGRGLDNADVAHDHLVRRADNLKQWRFPEGSLSREVKDRPPIMLEVSRDGQKEFVYFGPEGTFLLSETATDRLGTYSPAGMKPGAVATGLLTKLKIKQPKNFLTENHALSDPKEIKAVEQIAKMYNIADVQFVSDTAGRIFRLYRIDGRGESRPRNPSDASVYSLQSVVAGETKTTLDDGDLSREPVLNVPGIEEFLAEVIRETDGHYPADVYRVVASVVDRVAQSQRETRPDQITEIINQTIEEYSKARLPVEGSTTGETREPTSIEKTQIVEELEAMFYAPEADQTNSVRSLVQPKPRYVHALSASEVTRRSALAVTAEYLSRSSTSLPAWITSKPSHVNAAVRALVRSGVIGKGSKYHPVLYVMPGEFKPLTDMLTSVWGRKYTEILTVVGDYSFLDRMRPSKRPGDKGRMIVNPDFQETIKDHTDKMTRNKKNLVTGEDAIPLGIFIGSLDAISKKNSPAGRVLFQSLLLLDEVRDSEVDKLRNDFTGNKDVHGLRAFDNPGMDTLMVSSSSENITDVDLDNLLRQHGVWGAARALANNSEAARFVFRRYLSRKGALIESAPEASHIKLNETEVSINLDFKNAINSLLWAIHKFAPDSIERVSRIILTLASLSQSGPVMLGRYDVVYADTGARRFTSINNFLADLTQRPTAYGIKKEQVADLKLQMTDLFYNKDGKMRPYAKFFGKRISYKNVRTPRVLLDSRQVMKNIAVIEPAEGLDLVLSASNPSGATVTSMYLDIDNSRRRSARLAMNVEKAGGQVHSDIPARPDLTVELFDSAGIEAAKDYMDTDDRSEIRNFMEAMSPQFPEMYTELARARAQIQALATANSSAVLPGSVIKDPADDDRVSRTVTLSGTGAAAAIMAARTRMSRSMKGRTDNLPEIAQRLYASQKAFMKGEPEVVQVDNSGPLAFVNARRGVEDAFTARFYDLVHGKMVEVPSDRLGDPVFERLDYDFPIFESVESSPVQHTYSLNLLGRTTENLNEGQPDYDTLEEALANEIATLATGSHYTRAVELRDALGAPQLYLTSVNESARMKKDCVL